MMREHVCQETLTLPHFMYEVPVLYSEDGVAYVPVRAVCSMLGLRADTRIPRWRKLLLWEHARKLPLCIPQRGTRLVWCLHLGALPFLFGCFDWSYVRPDRLTQLRAATDEHQELLERIYQRRQTLYRDSRRLLFLFLTRMAGADQRLQETTRRLYASLDSSCWGRLEALVRLGSRFILEATTSARNMLHEQGRSLLVDAVQIDAEGQVGETFSLPLFPVPPREEDVEQFLLSGRMLLLWYEDFRAFLQEHGFPPAPLI